MRLQKGKYDEFENPNDPQREAILVTPSQGCPQIRIKWNC
jgi:hypothetical protein